jgi:hypothetical protein
VLKVYNDAIEKAQQNQMDDAEFLQLLERDVLPPWRNARQRLAQLKHVPAAGREFMKEFSNYMQVREEALELLCRALRQNDPHLAQQSRQQMQEADRLANKMTTDAGKRKH